MKNLKTQQQTYIHVGAGEGGAGALELPICDLRDRLLPCRLQATGREQILKQKTENR